MSIMIKPKTRVSDLAAGTDGEMITWDASGNPAEVAVGTATHVLTSNGAGAAPTFQAAAGGGQTLYECIVAPSGGDYTTLSAALSAGKTRIFIRNGSYSETGEPEIVSNTVIHGESRDGVIIDVDGTTNDRIVFDLDAALTNIEIKNVTFTCTTATNYILDQALDSGAVGDFVLENVILNNGGISIGDNATAGTGDIYFKDVIVRGAGTAFGLYVYNHTSTQSGFLHISNCSVSGSSYTRGIYVAGAYTEITAIGNQIDAEGGNMDYGIAIEANLHEGMIISNNIIANSADASCVGILTLGASTDDLNTIIANNVIFNCDGQAIYLNSENIICVGNYVDNNEIATSAGIVTGSSCKDVLIANNVVRNCTNYALDVSSGSTTRAVLSGNYLYNNTLDVRDSGVLTTIDESNHGISAVDRKVYQKMKNTDGDALAAGDVVVLKAVAAGNEVTHTTTAGDQMTFGMAAEAITNNSTGYIQTLGKTTALKVDGTDDIAVGDRLSAFTSAGIAQKAATGELVFAIALEAYTSDDSNGVIDALLITPRLEA